MQTPPTFEPVPERAIGALVVGAALVSSVAGIALTFVYRPDQVGFLRALHSGTAAIAVISAIAARVVGSGGRIKASARTIAVVVGLVLVLGAAFATGSTLAWKGAVPSDRGMFLAAGHHVRSDAHVMSAGGLMVSFAIHVSLGVCSFMVLGGRYVRNWWRQRHEAR